MQRLAESLASDGHRVAVYTTTAGEVESIWDPGKRALPPGEAQVNGVLVKRYSISYLPGAPYGYYLTRRVMGLIDAAGGPAGLLWRLAGLTPRVPALETAMAEDEGCYDIVHGFTIPFESVLQPACRLAARIGAPFFLTPFLHVGEEDGNVARGYAMRHQVELMRRAAGVIAMSSIERDFLAERGVEPEKVRVVPAGITVGPGDPPAWPPVERPTVLFLGAVTYDKGAVHLAEAVRRLQYQGMDVAATFAGGVTDGFRRYYQALPAADRERLRVLGPVSDEEKLRQLRECTLLAMPSRVDSFGLVYLEAWAQGKPVVGARAGGVPAVIDDGENGLLVPFGDVKALAGALATLVGSPDEAARLGRAGWHKLRRCYAWDSIYPSLLDLYREALDR